MALTPVADETQKYIELTAKGASDAAQRARQSGAHDDGGEKSGGGGGGKEKSGGGGGKSSGPREKSGLDKAIDDGAARFDPNRVYFPSSSNGGGGPLVMSNSHQLVMNELIQRGVKPEVAAGAVGSLMGESGNRLNPRSYNPNDNGGPSGGIAQWHNERLTNLYNFAGTNDINKIPLETQVKFLGHELDTTHSHVLDGLKKGSTVADGVNIWTRSYEVPANVDHQVELRMKHADQVWAGYQQGQSAPAAASAGGNDYISGLTSHYGGKVNGESGECVALVKKATGVGHTSNWQPGGGITANTPIGTPIATFGADGRYKNVPGQSHAAIYLGPGSQPGSIKVLDQWNGHAAGTREIHPGDKAESAQNFRTIATRDGSNPGLAHAPGVTPQPATAIPSYASVRADDKAMPANARTFMDTADVRGNPQEGQTVNIKDLESYDMAKNKSSVRAQDWKDPGAQENARRNPDTSTDRLPPRRPAEYDNPLQREGIPTIDRGAQPTNAGMPNKRVDAPQPPGTRFDALAKDNVPLPPERPAALDIPSIDKAPAPAPVSGPNPTVDAPLPPTRPGEIPPATSGPQHHENMGPPVPAEQGPPIPADKAVPTPPPSSDRPQTAVPPQTGGDWHNGMPQPGDKDWQAPMAAPAVAGGSQPAAAPASQPAQPPQQGASGDTGDLFGWLGSLFDNPDNLNGQTEQLATANADAGPSGGDNFDLGGGLDSIGNAVSSFFGGFERGGLVQSFVRGGLVGKPNTGRPDRVANAQPGVAIPAGNRNTDPGGGYSARRSISAGYARGGLVDGDVTTGDGGEPAPAPAVEAPAETPAVDTSSPAIPESGYDAEPIIGPNSQEAKQQAQLEKYAEQKRIAQESKQPKNLRELLSQTAFNVVSGVERDYGIDTAVKRQQGQAVPAQQGEDDPISAFFNMLSGAPEEAAKPEQVKALGDAVDPYNKLTDGMRTTAGMAAGVEYLLNKGDFKGAQEMARSVMFHQQLMTAKWGDQAVDLLQRGDKNAAIDAMVKGQQNIPDGTNVSAKATQGGAEVTQRDENGKVMGHHKVSDAQLMGMALGLKDGTAYWQSIVHLANNDKIDAGVVSDAYQEWQNRPQTAITPPEDVNSPQYALHKDAVRVLGPQPQLPHNFSQMTPAEQKQTKAEVGEARQAWNTNYSQYMQGGRQQEGFRYRTENREDNQQFRTGERVAGQEYRTGERVAGQEYRTGERVAGQEFRHNEQIGKEERGADRSLSGGKFDKAVNEALTTVLPNLDPSDPRAASVTGTAGSLLSKNPGLAPVDAVKAATAVLANKGEIRDDNGVKKIKLFSGQELVLPDGVGTAPPPPNATPAAPTASWGLK